MRFPLILLFLLLVVAVILIVLIGLGVFTTQTQEQTIFEAQLAEAISLQQGFCSNGNCNGEPVTCTGNSSDSTSLCRGNCLLYGTFSTDVDVVDNLTPIANVSDPNLPADFKCTDGFVQALEKRTATCQQTECVGRNGDRYTQGQTEQFYITCGGLSQCSDSFRSAIVLRFAAEGQSFDEGLARCISANIIQDEVNFSVSDCDAQVELTNEIFLNVAQTPCNIIVESDVPNALGNIPISGTALQIRASATGKCLNFSNGQLVAEDCLTMDNNGYVWFTFDRIEVPLQPTTLFPNDEFIVPSQIIYLGSKGCTPQNDAGGDFVLTGLDSLQTGGDTLEIKQIGTCFQFPANSPPSSCSNNTTIPETLNTQIVSAQTWNCLN